MRCEVQYRIRGIECFYATRMRRKSISVAIEAFLGGTLIFRRQLKYDFFFWHFQIIERYDLVKL